MARRTINVNYIARVEGEGALHIDARNGKVHDTRLEIFEPPRLFEAFLRGRAYSEAVDITARICGICPVAYEISASNALDDALGIRVTPEIRSLRRLLYCGEWIESHVLHIYMLHAPDFLGYEDAIALAKDHPEIVERGLRMKKAGNAMLETVGGRAIHPINVRAGGFYKAPSKRELLALRDELQWGIEAARDTVRWAGSLTFPDFEQDYVFLALHDPDRYAIENGTLLTNRGLAFPVAEFEGHVEEKHVAHSNALQAEIRGLGPYMTGPLARYALNFDQLSPLAQDTAGEAGLGREVRNPFQSIVVRSVEVLYAFEEALRIVESYEAPDPLLVEHQVRAATGHGASEAPRGTLYHRYSITDDGSIAEARIVPPTSQNQRRIELDLAGFVEPRLDLPRDQLTWECEQMVRNYDPCISCATHFLTLTVEGDS